MFLVSKFSKISPHFSISFWKFFWSLLIVLMVALFTFLNFYSTHILPSIDCFVSTRTWAAASRNNSVLLKFSNVQQHVIFYDTLATVKDSDVEGWKMITPDPKVGWSSFFIDVKLDKPYFIFYPRAVGGEGYVKIFIVSGQTNKLVYTMRAKEASKWSDIGSQHVIFTSCLDWGRFAYKTVRFRVQLYGKSQVWIKDDNMFY